MKNVHLIHVNRAKASLYHCSNTRDLFTTEQTPGDLLDEKIKDIVSLCVNNDEPPKPKQ